MLTTPRKRTPSILQMADMECGAVSLAIILATYKRYVPLEELREACGVSPRKGARADRIVKAAREYGLEVKSFRHLGLNLDDSDSPEKVLNLPMPCVAWWNWNHYLVVEGSKNGCVYLNDPASGPKTVSLDDFLEGFTAVVLTFKPGENFEEGGVRPSLLSGLLPRVKAYKSSVVYFVITALILLIPALATPAFQSVFVDDVLVAGRSQWLSPLLLIMAITALFTASLTWLQQHYLLRYQISLAVSESYRFFRHILRLPIAFFAHVSAAKLKERLWQNNPIAHAVAESGSLIVADTLKLLFFSMVMFCYDYRLALITIALGMGNLGMLICVNRIKSDYYEKLIHDGELLAITTNTGLQCIETIKGTGDEDAFFTRLAGYQAKTFATKQELSYLDHISSAAPRFVAALTGVALLGMGGWLIVHGNLTIGMFVAFQAISQNFSTLSNNIVANSSAIQKLPSSMSRNDDVLKCKPDVYFEKPSMLDMTNGQMRLSGRMQMTNITFGYNTKDKPLLTDFSLTISPGQRVALVGDSGSGKSTIAKLVAGLYQPWSGDICFDNIPSNKLPRHLLNNSLAVVDQKLFFFTGTVRDNLTMWDATIPDTILSQALLDACMLDEISKRPGGLNSRVEEHGRNFSGGQLQRLEIARALVMRPSFLVLDEATSSLDPRTEKDIEKNLMARGCACLIVAHRLSSIRDCDEIIVMKDSRVAQRGTHNKLLQETGGEYHRLYTQC